MWNVSKIDIIKMGPIRNFGVEECNEGNEKKYATEGNDGRLDQPEETVNLNTVIWNYPVRGEEKNSEKEWRKPIELWENMKLNLFIHYRCLRREERGNGPESLLPEIMAEYFPNLGRDWNIQVYEAHMKLIWSSRQIHPKKIYSKTDHNSVENQRHREF